MSLGSNQNSLGGDTRDDSLVSREFKNPWKRIHGIAYAIIDTLDAVLESDESNNIRLGRN